MFAQSLASHKLLAILRWWSRNSSCVRRNSTSEDSPRSPNTCATWCSDSAAVDVRTRVWSPSLPVAHDYNDKLPTSRGISQRRHLATDCQPLPSYRLRCHRQLQLIDFTSVQLITRLDCRCAGISGTHGLQTRRVDGWPYLLYHSWMLLKAYCQQNYRPTPFCRPI